MFYVAQRGAKSASQSDAPPKSATADKPEDLYKALKVDPVEIVIGSAMVAMVGPEGNILADKLVSIRKQYALEMGIVLPLVRVRDERRLGANRYEIWIFGTKVADGEVIPDRLLAINPGGQRAALEGQVALDPAYRLPAVWVDEAQRSPARLAGYTVVDALTVFITHLSEVLKQNTHNLITRAETERLIARVREQQSGLVDDLIPKVLALGDVQRVLQSLVKERVPIRNIDAILEVLADYGSKTKESEVLTELVRERLGRMICQQLVDSHGELQVLTFDPSIEQSIAAAVRPVEEKPTLILEPRLAEQVLRRLSEEVDRMARGNLRPVLLCAPTLRRHVRRLTERLVPQLSVLSLNEVPTQMNLRAFGVVKV